MNEKVEATVRLLGAFRIISGKNCLSLGFEGEKCVGEAVDEIVEELPKLKDALIDPELKDPRPNALILLNGKEINVLNGLKTLIKNGDEMILIPVSHGG